MSMNPVESISSSRDLQPEAPVTHVSKPSADHVPNNRPGSSLGPDPNRQIRVARKEPETSGAAQGEVQVQRDSQDSDVIVIEYLDRSGNLVLQMPSSQVLRLAQAIEKALEQDAQNHLASRAVEARSEGGSSDGH